MKTYTCYAPNRHKAAPVPPREELKQKKQQLGTLAEVAKHYGVSRSTVGRWIYKYGLGIKGEQ